MKTTRLMPALLALTFLALTGCGYTTIDTGHRGIKTVYGKVEGGSLPEDMYTYNAWSTDIVQMDVRQRKWSGKTETYTKDVQQADVTFTLLFRPDPDKAHVLYRDVGQDWAQKIVGQVVIDEIKQEMGQHEAVDLISKLGPAGENMRKAIIPKLAQRHVIVEGFELTDVAYTPDFEKSVEDKVKAAQKAIEEENRTQSFIEQAKQAEETAKGRKKAVILAAEAEAEQIKLKGDAEAYAIRVRAKALQDSPLVLEWEKVKSWNGALPMYVSDGAAGALIQLPAK